MSLPWTQKKPTNVSDQSSNNMLVYKIILYSHRHVPVKSIKYITFSQHSSTSFCGSSLCTLCILFKSCVQLYWPLITDRRRW